ncbi:hypothetical protein UNPF46_21645 [Bradyrhizobium sp. UNPF46]|nr:hypothetical protein UNPF46_21645 [Bradyrhizobium sp. UNPF46]
MSIGGLVVAMHKEVRSCANIRVSVGEPIGCVMRQDETMTKFFASMFQDGFAASIDAARS